jgi:uncharacterized protein DUF4266
VRRFALLLVLLGVGGCARVKPYEREFLAKPIMVLDRDPQATILEQHVYEYREGSTGGYGSAGGGCGCN